MPRQQARALAVETARGHLWDKSCWMLRPCRGRDVGRGSAFASPTTYDVTTSAQELDDRYRPCQRVACPLSSGAQPGSHPSGPRHWSCGSAACSRTRWGAEMRFSDNEALYDTDVGPICGNP
jgi:hypothetical protein